LKEEKTLPLHSLIHEETLHMLEGNGALSKGFISFHFMGMAVFDLAVSSFFYHSALKNKVGLPLPD
jgi:ornithine cyclodeaminase/alanine dehydrogenase-like protein (mu-crystallin family)